MLGKTHAIQNDARRSKKFERRSPIKALRNGMVEKPQSNRVSLKYY